MKLLAINGSPRRAKNTAALMEKVTEGAASAGAEAELVHLRDIEFGGCISCMHCKLPERSSYGRCIRKDGLTEILDKAHQADAVALGSPIYFMAETSLMRTFMERFCYQYFLYSNIKPPLSPPKRTALIYTMNIPEAAIEATPLKGHIDFMRGVMVRLFGSCEVFLCTDTKQVKDYSRYDMDMFDIPAKEERHRQVFPRDLERAFALGAQLAG